MAMSPQHKHALVANRLTLVRDVILSDELFAVLLADYTLTNSLVQDIEAGKTSQNRVGKLLDILPKRGDKAFATFITALKETHQELLAVLLDPSGGSASTQGASKCHSQATDQRMDPQTGRTSKLSPSDISSFNKQPFDKKDENNIFAPDKQPLQPVKENKGTPLQEQSQSVAEPQSVNFVNFSEDIIQLINEAHRNKEVFIYDKFHCDYDDEPDKKVSLSKGRCAIFRNIYAKHRSSFYEPDFDDVNLCEAFKKFGIVVECTHENKKSEEILRLLEKEAEKEEDTSAFILLMFASGFGDGDNLLAHDDKLVSIDDIIRIVNESPSLKGKPKVLIFQLTNSVGSGGEATDSIAEPSPLILSSNMSQLKINDSGKGDNLAILKTIPSADGLEIHWVVWALVFLLTKYSKQLDLSTMLQHVECILKRQGYSVTLSNTLQDGLYFSSAVASS